MQSVNDVSTNNEGLEAGGEHNYTYDQIGNLTSDKDIESIQWTVLSLRRDDANDITIDRINYTYNTTQNNRLQNVNDVSGNNEGLEANGVHSYTYDDIGNLTSDRDIQNINWTVYGKIESVLKRDGTEIEYKYDGTGQRIYKKVVSSSVSKETHYVRDGSENVLAIYENEVLDELVIYGSSRLGSYNGKTSEGKRTLGNKKYELSNHLGNVLSVISDNKIGIGSNGVADYYEPLVISESDYYPFGMAMKERSFSNEEYRFGFNGMEEDRDFGSEITNHGARLLNKALGRWFACDPLEEKYPSVSTFAFVANSPLRFIDPDGKKIDVSELQKTSEGRYVLYNILEDLSKFTGRNITVDENGLIIDGGISSKYQGDGDTKNYVLEVINSDGVIKVSNDNSQTTYANNTGEININSGNVQPNDIGVDNQISTLESAGLNSDSFGYGMTFLHETLHTWTGTFAYLSATIPIEADADNAMDNRNDPFGDAQGKTALMQTGETVDIINSFRQNLGLANRDSYLYTINQQGQSSFYFGGQKIPQQLMSQTDKLIRRIGSVLNKAIDTQIEEVETILNEELQKEIKIE